ncbi:hypothetical protein [Staphylococcus sp. GDY8P193P]|uniref:hypothetical protein n=1 Tax=Staphylococcus sp. GDY8P193P TaxID=2804171 RepID=UPI001AEBD87F|nr:hypothetical protein [Staphylococcus sp. GDY8P193P]
MINSALGILPNPIDRVKRYVDETRGIIIYPNDASLKLFEFGPSFTNLYDYYYRGSLDIKLSLFLMSQFNLDKEDGCGKTIAYIY